MIYENLNDVAQLILLGEQRLLHSGELSNEVIEAFPHCISFYRDHVLVVRKLPVGDVNVYLDRHVLFLFHKWGTPACRTGRQIYVPYEVFLLLPYLFGGFDKFDSRIPLFGHLNLVRVDISDSFRITEGYTLRIPVTVITFHGHPVLDIEEGMTKGACDDTGPASDAQGFINDHPVIIIRLSVTGLGRTDLHAVGLFTVIAGHGEVDSHMLPFDHFNAGPAWIAGPGMMHGAHQLTETAPGTLLLINDQYLLLHFKSLP
jgi:hypothetical protein